jgi:hypothetical protein
MEAPMLTFFLTVIAISAVIGAAGWLTDAVRHTKQF